MAELNAPERPGDIWLAVGSEVPGHRLLMQGDVVLTADGPVCIVAHACAMRYGSVLHPTQIVAPIEDHRISRWTGNYDWMPLDKLSGLSAAHPAANLRTLRSVPTDDLTGGNRLAVMSDQGIHLLQQRLACHLTRVVIELPELAEHSAPILAEVDLHEEWVEALGVDSEEDFHTFLDDNQRKIRGWLAETHTRPQATRTVRQEIRARRAS